MRSGQTGSGTGHFDLTLNYDTGRFTGQFGWRDLRLHGVSYAAASSPLDSPAASPGTQILDSEIGVLASQTPAGAGAKFFASVGPISDGTHLLDGQLGGFEMRVFDGGAQELARDPDGNLLDQDGNITTDASQALAIPALSATIWTRGE